MTIPTRADVIERVAALPWRSEVGRATWCGMIPTAKAEGFRTWCMAHSGTHVATLQVGPTGSWAPGERRMDAGATYAILGGSRRDYAGVQVIVSDSQTMVAYDVSMETIIVYRAV